MIVFPKKSIYTIYIIWGLATTVRAVVGALYDLKYSIFYWLICCGIVLVVMPFSALVNRITVHGNQITIVQKDALKNKKIVISFDELDYIQETYPNFRILSRGYRWYFFSIYVKGRNDIRLVEPNYLHFINRDLRKLFLYLEKEANVEYRRICPPIEQHQNLKSRECKKLFNNKRKGNRIRDNFIGYVGDYKVHNSKIQKLDCNINYTRVVLKSIEGENINVKFSGVYRVFSKNPVGMVLRSIDQMEENRLYSRFCFVNGNQDNGASLEIIAHEYQIEK